MRSGEKNKRKTNENECKENVEIEKEESEVKGEECQIEIDFPIEIDERAKKRPITDCAESDRDSARSFVLKRCKTDRLLKILQPGNENVVQIRSKMQMMMIAETKG